MDIPLAERPQPSAMDQMIDSPFLFLNDQFADVEIIADDRSFGRAHKVVLYNRSSKLREILDKDIDTHQIDLGFLWKGSVLTRKKLIGAFLEAIYTGRLHPKLKSSFEPTQNGDPSIIHLSTRLLIYNCGHTAGASLLQSAAAENFKQHFNSIDMETDPNLSSYESLIKRLYGTSGRLDGANLPADKDKHGIRDFFKKHHLPGASKYLSRQKTEELVKKCPKFAVDFYRSIAPDLSTITWREDNTNIEHEEEGRDVKRRRFQ
ncbi:uncharacterized protein J3D65DRAFT_695768 [Phyllosticta citribraziliensis]|uniref:BTB domain-containing protein n=1 Tax=Phyllosticta citribraziliensis TaxID=989973 RepID=A0ABR1LQ81_9PEZI